jgi:hypothetical protein
MLVYKPGPYGTTNVAISPAKKASSASAAVFVAAMPAPSRYSGGLAVLSKTIDANPNRGVEEHALIKRNSTDVK